MKHLQSVPDWSTQATQAMHGRLFSRGGKQGLPLYVDEEKPPPIDLKNDWLIYSTPVWDFCYEGFYTSVLQNDLIKIALNCGLLYLLYF